LLLSELLLLLLFLSLSIY